MRIVLDTASLISAIRSSTGAANEVVRLVLRRELTNLMDYKLGSEYRDVALRPEYVAVSALSSEAILDLIDTLESLAEPVKVIRQPRPLSPAPNDDMILDIALNGRADAIVTSNTRHFAAAGKRLKISVLTPAQLLQSLDKGERHAE